MFRSIEECREIARREGFSYGEIARACDPPRKTVTVWRVMTGKHGGHVQTVQAISTACERLLDKRGRPAPCGEQV